MAQSYVCLHYHIVFAVKQRRPAIADDWRQRLWEYIAGIVRQHQGHAHEVGGMPDHLHLLASIHQSLAIADFVRDVKAGSSGWIHDALRMTDFAWQAGYSAFTVSHSGLKQVSDYIRNQRQHHLTRSFDEELRLLLERHGVAIDERYFLRD